MSAKNGNGFGVPLGVAVRLLPTPTTSDTNGVGAHGTGGADLRTAVARLLPTPTTQPLTGNGHARNLGSEARLLPTPSVADATGGHHSRSGARSDELLLKGIAHHDRFGEYAAAIVSHARLAGRPAPDPTEPGRKGPRLSARFAEWMMCVPDGWIVDTPGITWAESLKAAGNGVVPPQAAAGIRHALHLLDLDMESR